VAVRVLELHTPGGMHTIQRVGTDPEFGQLVEAVRYRLPGRQSKSILARTRPDRFH
jgi:hypothetical protein